MIKGIQLHGWADGPQMVEVAEIAAGSFETVWLSDQLQSRASPFSSAQSLRAPVSESALP